MDNHIMDEFGGIVQIMGILVGVLIAVFVTIKIVRIVRFVQKSKNTPKYIGNERIEGYNPKGVDSSQSAGSGGSGEARATGDINTKEFLPQCVDLLKKGGFTDIDVINEYNLVANKNNVGYFIHCKEKSILFNEDYLVNLVSSKDQHKKSVCVIISTQTFVPVDYELAEEYGVRLWEPGFLREMAEANDDEE